MRAAGLAPGCFCAPNCCGKTRGCEGARRQCWGEAARGAGCGIWAGGAEGRGSSLGTASEGDAAPGVAAERWGGGQGRWLSPSEMPSAVSWQQQSSPPRSHTSCFTRREPRNAAGAHSFSPPPISAAGQGSPCRVGWHRRAPPAATRGATAAPEGTVPRGTGEAPRAELSARPEFGGSRWGGERRSCHQRATGGTGRGAAATECTAGAGGAGFGTSAPAAPPLPGSRPNPSASTRRAALGERHTGTLRAQGIDPLPVTAAALSDGARQPSGCALLAARLPRLPEDSCCFARLRSWHGTEQEAGPHPCCTRLGRAAGLSRGRPGANPASPLLSAFRPSSGLQA